MFFIYNSEKYRSIIYKNFKWALYRLLFVIICKIIITWVIWGNGNIKVLPQFILCNIPLSGHSILTSFFGEDIIKSLSGDLSKFFQICSDMMLGGVIGTFFCNIYMEIGRGSVTSHDILNNKKPSINDNISFMENSDNNENNSLEGIGQSSENRDNMEVRQLRDGTIWFTSNRDPREAVNPYDLNESNQEHNPNVPDSIQGNSNQDNENIDPYLLELTRQEEAARREAEIREKELTRKRQADIGFAAWREQALARQQEIARDRELLRERQEEILRPRELPPLRPDSLALERPNPLITPEGLPVPTPDNPPSKNEAMAEKNRIAPKTTYTQPGLSSIPSVELPKVAEAGRYKAPVPAQNVRAISGFVENDNTLENLLRLANAASEQSDRTNALNKIMARFDHNYVKVMYRHHERGIKSSNLFSNSFHIHSLDLTDRDKSVIIRALKKECEKSRDLVELYEDRFFDKDRNLYKDKQVINWKNIQNGDLIRTKLNSNKASVWTSVLNDKNGLENLQNYIRNL